MNRIRILPEAVACQIAAGEVVDRPASIVRELIDNSLDAGADRVSIRTESGGRRVIRVVDNGLGMGRDDLLLSIERHATSKIRSADDLFSIRSLGFRGEALPSIAAVSRMTITSRRSGELGGHRLSISGGRLDSIEETGTPEGTIIEVRDLFFNMPARRKFLRAAKTETGHVAETVSRMLPAFTDVFFRYQEREREIINAPPSSDVVPRFVLLMGRETAESMLHAEERFEGFTVQVFVAPGEFSRSRADRLFMYVNRRYIRDRLLTKALLEGYRERLMKGTYPQAAVFIDLEPGLVDVNVHPTKQELRFNDGNAVFQALVSTVGKCLGKSFYSIPEDLYPAGGGRIEPFHADREVLESDWKYEKSPDGPEGSDMFSGREPPGQTSFFRGPRLLGSIGGTYLICETEEGMLMIDQHAAHERILYEELKRQVQDSGIQVQALLLPLQFELSGSEKRILDQKADILQKLGVELEHFGGNTYILRAVPLMLQQADWREFIPDLIASVDEVGFDEEKIFEAAIASMACHGAIKARDRITDSEISALVSRLRGAAIPGNCPHGRPVFKLVTFREIEKMFKRVV
ncbi:MAG: DNA mismatch repair endonuclease MutL [Desulfatiglandaceae bacterium]